MNLHRRKHIRRFSRDKIWERKAAAYTAIFEALHYIGRWYDKHYEASLIQKEINEEKSIELQSEANKAEAELERRLSGANPGTVINRLHTLNGPDVARVDRANYNSPCRHPAATRQ